MKKILTFFLCIVLLASSNCIVSAAGTKNLSVVNTNIKNKQKDVKTDSVIKVSFNNDIIKGVNFKKITLTSSDKKNIAFTITISKTSLTVKPKAALEYLTGYTLIIPANSVADKGKKLKNNKFTLTFTTADKSDIQDKEGQKNNDKKAENQTDNKDQKDSDTKNDDQAKDGQGTEDQNGSSLKPEDQTSQKLKDLLKSFVLSVTPDDGKRIEGGQIPYAIRLNDGRIRMYYVAHGDIVSAVSNDGLDFSEEDGIRIQNGVNPTVVITADGKFRIYYNRITKDPVTGYQIHKIYSAISKDGLNFTEEGLCFEPSTDYANYTSVPDAVITADGKTRLYYITDNKTGKIETKNTSGIGSSISDDGKAFTREAGNRIDAENFCDPSVIQLPNGNYIMFNDHNESAGKYSVLGLYASISADGINFSDPILVIPDSKLHRITDPCVFKISKDTYRVYYWQLGEADMAILSATIKVDPSSFGTKPLTSDMKLITQVKQDDGSITTGGQPSTLSLDDGRVRLFYYNNGISSMISSDGLTFTAESGIRITQGPAEICADATVVKMPDGKYRLYYKSAHDVPAGIERNPVNCQHQVYSAVSDDGFTFTKEGIRIPDHIASVPEAIVLPDGRVRLYYVGFDDSNPDVIYSAISEDGLNFTPEKLSGIPRGAYDPAITRLSNGYYWMVCAFFRNEYGKETTGLYSYISEDGLNFVSLGELFNYESSTGMRPLDPGILRIDNDTYRIFYSDMGLYGQQVPSLIKSITVDLDLSVFN